jgi:hypothetical protein
MSEELHHRNQKWGSKPKGGSFVMAVFVRVATTA